MGKARKARGLRTSKDIKEVDECDDPPDEEIGLCITHLPRPISIDILLRLPLNCVIICQCVCKTWQSLIKDSEFVRLHISRAESYPLVRAVGPTHISRIIYFVHQPPKCNPSERYLNMKLDTKLRIPLHNAEIAMNGEGDANMNLNSKRKRITKLRPKDHKLNVVNSCNGFLCLSERYHNNPVMVCNPITREFVKIPLPTNICEVNKGLSDCGLGFCPKTNRYKVVRMFNQETDEFAPEPVTGREIWCHRVAEIHTLGTNTWKTIGFSPSSCHKLGFCTYLSGTLNWLYLSYDHPYYIVSFDFENEKFQSIPIPPKRYGQMSMQTKSKISIGELRGCLCVCDASDNRLQKNELWVMKTYGVESSWRKEFKIKMSTREGRLLHGLYEPMSYFKDGTILFFHPLSSAVFSYNSKDKYMKFLKVRGIVSKFEAIAYIPSFLSLKDALIGDDVEVYNVNSRCGRLKLQGESKTVSLVEEVADLASDFDMSCSEDEKRDQAWWEK